MNSILSALYFCPSDIMTGCTIYIEMELVSILVFFEQETFWKWWCSNNHGKSRVEWATLFWVVRRCLAIRMPFGRNRDVIGIAPLHIWKITCCLLLRWRFADFIILWEELVADDDWTIHLEFLSRAAKKAGLESCTVNCLCVLQINEVRWAIEQFTSEIVDYTTKETHLLCTSPS